MTKEEKIKEAWGELWNSFNESAKKCALSKNGFVGAILQNGLNKDFTEFNAELKAWRPKSLQGIENNNGWIKIKSEDDLPKENGVYWTLRYGLIVPLYKEVFNDLDVNYWLKTYTHYQPIEKPKPPLY